MCVYLECKCYNNYDCRDDRFVGAGMFFIAFARLGLGLLHFSSMICQKYLTFRKKKNSHFSILSLNPKSFMFGKLPIRVLHVHEFYFLLIYRLEMLLQRLAGISLVLPLFQKVIKGI